MTIQTFVAVLVSTSLASTAAFSLYSSFHQGRRSKTSLDAAIGLFFGTSTGNTETVAEALVEAFGSDIVEGPIDIDSIQGSVAAEFAKHDALVVGTPTWNTGADTERSGTGWDEIYYGEMQDLKLEGKKVAVFGLGDSVSYSENFADASGELHDVFEALGCKMMGYTSQEGYEHESSKAIRGDLFCGLLNDMINQDDLMPERVANWVEQLKVEGILGSSSISPAAVESTESLAPVVDVVSTAEEPQANGKTIAVLEAENAELRRLLEQQSLMLDENIAQMGTDENGFVPHNNAKTGRTMWTSPDGRYAYYTAPVKSNKKLSP